MRLEDLTVVLRPRHSWEAVDLGCCLVRRDFPRILSLWFATVVPFWIVLAIVLRDYPVTFAGIAWWLKPLYDRMPLHYLSRATFGNRPGFWETWKEWPRLWTRFLLPALLWRRLSPARSFMLPVWLLEGQRGKNLRLRARGLAMEGSGSGATLTWAFVKLELAVFSGLLILVSFAAPESGLPNLADIVDSGDTDSLVISNAYYWWTNLWYLAALSLVEPFYVGAGFGLYLNCRTKLEGWDVEVTFRKTAARLAQVAAPLASVVILIFSPATVWCTEQPPADKNAVSISRNGNDLAKSVIQEPEFKVHSKTNRVWVPVEKKAALTFPSFFGQVIAVLGYLGIILLLVFLVVQIVRSSLRFRSPMLAARQTTGRPPRFVLGMEITPDSLPKDIVGAARAAWLNGGAKEALSLLYRGALASLVIQHRVSITSSDTEEDCLAHVSTSVPASLISYFNRLTQAWSRAAYADQFPDPPLFDSLCGAWPFTATPSKQASAARLLPVFVALPALLLSSCNGYWEDVTHETGYKGPARINPFLAAGRLLEKQGHEIERAHTLRDLPPPASGLVFTSAEGGMPAGRAAPLLQWVANGGHLVYALAGGAPYNDWSLFSALSSYGYFGNDTRPDPILEALTVTARDRRTKEEMDETPAGEASPEKEKKSAREKSRGDTTGPSGKPEKAEQIEQPDDVSLVTATLGWQRRKLSVNLPDYVTFQLSRKLRAGEYLAGTTDAALLLSLRHGNGRITLMPHARPLRNRYLADADHGRFLDTLAGPHPVEALFVIGFEGSFWQLLWERAWRPILALALLVLLWLWLSLPRFGPVRHVALHATKRFADHLIQLGGFYHGVRRQDHLIAAAQSALRQRLSLTHPHLSDPDGQRNLLSSRAQLPLDRVRAALDDPHIIPASQIIRILQDLQILRLSLS